MTLSGSHSLLRGSFFGDLMGKVDISDWSSPAAIIVVIFIVVGISVGISYESIEGL